LDHADNVATGKSHGLVIDAVRVSHQPIKLELRLALSRPSNVENIVEDVDLARLDVQRDIGHVNHSATQKEFKLFFFFKQLYPPSPFLRGRMQERVAVVVQPEEMERFENTVRKQKKDEEKQTTYNEHQSPRERKDSR